MNLINKNTKVYYISTFFLFLGSTMPHSILTVLFLKKGLLMSQIVLMQSFFNLSMIIFEIPSGVMSDLYSRKKVYILSLLTLFITFFIFSIICPQCLSRLIGLITISALDFAELIKTKKNGNNTKIAIIVAIIVAIKFLFFSGFIIIPPPSSCL